ncbi:unnamed protein product [Adineta ricciae]|uniref:Uncharacterized protein n=1 Tax=Adineta ricciae TaxID=249248 RepID=A0A815KEH5_ADIRI|nr:unnamed protein product [Adineta ricciae]CAF1638176.1 unnamed protein product [Adineta ricciae]
MSTKVDTGCRELALPQKLVEQLRLKYQKTVAVSSSTQNNVPIKCYGPVLIYWEGIIHSALAYCMPNLDSALPRTIVPGSSIPLISGENPQDIYSFRAGNHEKRLEILLKEPVTVSDYRL